ncbi:MAG: hypothetical protein ACXWIU_02555 [Limisphaerales bacterium]
MHTNTSQTGTLNTEFAALRQQWDLLRTHSRQIAADSQQLRRQSRELVKEWRLALGKTKDLRIAIEFNRQSHQSPPPPSITHDKPFVATARRVPWRQVQMKDVDGPIKVWVAPDFEEI